VTGEVSVRFLGRSGEEDDALVAPLRFGDIVLTREPINVKFTEQAIVAFGSIKITGLDPWNKEDEGRTVESILTGFLDRIVERDPFDENIGWIYSAFQESKYAKDQNIKARLYTGCRIDQLPPYHRATALARHLMSTKSYSCHEVTRGVFALPRELKHILRAGLQRGGTTGLPGSG